MKVIEPNTKSTEYATQDDYYIYKCPVPEFKLIRIKSSGKLFEENTDMPSIIFAFNG